MGTDSCVVAGQAAFGNSLMSPSNRFDVTTRKWRQLVEDAPALESCLRFSAAGGIAETPACVGKALWFELDDEAAE